MSSISQVLQLKFWKVVCVNQPPNCFWVHPKRPNAICFHRMCFSNFEIKQIRTADALNRCCSQRIQLLQAVLTRYVRLKMVVMSDYTVSSPPASRRPQQATSYGESSFPQERTPARPNLAGDAPEPAGSGRFLHTGPRHVLLTAQMWVDTAPPAQHQPIMSLYKAFIVYICDIILAGSCARTLGRSQRPGGAGSGK